MGSVWNPEALCVFTVSVPPALALLSPQPPSPPTSQPLNDQCFSLHTECTCGGGPLLLHNDLNCFQLKLL